MKKLIHQDDNEINYKIREIEALFPKIDEINTLLKPYLGEITLETLKLAISVPSSIKARYISAVEDEVKRLNITTPTVKANFLNGVFADIDYILSKIKESSTDLIKIINYISIENGRPYLSKENLESIYESSRLYITTAVGEKAYQLHREAVEKMNEFLKYTEDNFDFRFSDFKNRAILPFYAKYDPVDDKFKPTLYNYDLLIKKTTKHEH